MQVLSEQIAAQSEKMADLERALHETRQKLDDADQRLQKVLYNIDISFFYILIRRLIHLV